jgi:antirestriction protein ArdC
MVIANKWRIIMDTKKDIRQEVTNRMLGYLEKGTVPWRKAWTSASSRPINARSNKPYAGVNSLILGMAMFENANFASDNRFITGAQAHEMGLKIREGEQSPARVIRMVKVNRRKAQMETEGEVLGEEDDKFLVMKTYAVFHASQLQPPGLPAIVVNKAETNSVAEVGTIVNAMKATGLKIAEGPFEPVFIPKLDLIRMPPMASFKGIDAQDTQANYFGTLLHEISHAVGAPKRTGRFGMSPMTLSEAAMEELVAEWSAAMMCSSIKGIKLGDDHIQQHSAYLASWMRALKEDKGAIFRAAAAAQRTCDYLDKLVAPTHEETVVNASAANEQVVPVAMARKIKGPI